MMDMELYNVINDSQFNMNCTKFTEGNWKSLNLVAIDSLLGTVIILAILLFLIHNKVYSTLLQRFTVRLSDYCNPIM